MLAWILALAAQAPLAAPADQAAPAAASAPLPEVTDLVSGLRELRALSEEQRTDEALAVGAALLAPNRVQRWRTDWEARHPWTRGALSAAEPLFELCGAGGLSAEDRGEVHYALGVALAESGKLAEAGASFETAIALAGPGDLRLDALYDRGAVALAAAELVRQATLAEPKVPPSPHSPAQAGSPGESDPLSALKQMYVRAKALLIERLRADARDEDTRANLELAQRRLREIEELQKQQQAQQEQQQDSQQNKDGEKQPQDPKSDSQPSDEQQQQSDKDQQQSEQQLSEQQQEQRGEQPEEGERKEGASDGQQVEQQEQRVLTREEMMRLLDQLEQIEKQGQTLQMRLKDARRRKVEKDW